MFQAEELANVILARLKAGRKVAITTRLSPVELVCLFPEQYREELGRLVSQSNWFDTNV